MFKQELPLLFPEDADVAAVRDAMFDPFEYFVLRHRDGLLNTDFKSPLGGGLPTTSPPVTRGCRTWGAENPRDTAVGAGHRGHDHRTLCRS